MKFLPHEAFEFFGWTLSDGFDILKLNLHRLPAETAKVNGSHFWKKICLPQRNAG